MRVVDTHPLAPSDPNGVDIFYLMLVATIVGFLTVFQVRSNAGGLQLYHWTALVVGLRARGGARPHARGRPGPGSGSTCR